MNDRICAVVVTYNRKGPLANCLRSLATQTRPPDSILVVDNSSTDGTDAMLAEDFAAVSTLRLPTNSGGAGGFHDGMKWAYERGFTWIWVMDDDVEAMPDALASLLEFRRLSDFIHPRRITDRGLPFPWEGVFDPTTLNKKSYPQDVSFEGGRSWIPVNYGCFEGALINRHVINRIGLPDKRYFLVGDDQIYGHEATRCTNVIYINKVCFRRQLPVPDTITERRCYIEFRNRFLTYEHLSASALPMSRVTLWIQNIILMTWHIRITNPKRPLAYWRNIRGMICGMRDGARSRFGPPPWIEQ